MTDEMIPLAGVEAEKVVQAIMHEVFKYADVAAPLRGPPMTQDESLPARRASLEQDKVIRDMLYALVQKPAAVDGWVLVIKPDRDGETGVWAVNDDNSIWVSALAGQHGDSDNDH